MKEGKDNLPPSASKRKFLKLGALAVAGAVIGYPKLKDEALNIFSEEELKKDIKELVNFLRNNYGLDIKADIFGTPRDGDYYIKGENPSLAEQKQALVWLRREIGKYPSICIKNSRLKSIFLVKNLVAGADNVGGVTIGENLFISLGGNYVDLYNLLGWLDSSEFKETFHHELFHAVENIDNPDWAKLNKGGENAYLKAWQYNLNWRDLDKELEAEVKQFIRPIGFASQYGQTNEFEDKATVAQLLITNPQRAFSLAQKDTVFSKKLEVCKKAFKELSDGKMDESFWQDLMAGKVDEDYWFKSH